MSRIDKFLLSEDWCFGWPNCVQTALLRGLSDHFPLGGRGELGTPAYSYVEMLASVPGYK